MIPHNFEESKLLLTPGRGQAVCERLRKEINVKRGLNLRDYNDLHAYSVSDYAFWLDLWQFMGIIYSVPPDPAKIIAPGPIPERPSWFQGARLNYAENLLWRNDDGIAITAVYEYAFDPKSGGGFTASGALRTTHGLQNYTYRELREIVRRIANAMKGSGLGVGDRVAAIITNSASGVAVALAAAAIGAVFSSTSTDMGAPGILDRYKQIRPKILFASTETTYAGKPIRITEKIREVQSSLREGGFGLERCVILRSEITNEVIEVMGCQTMDAFLSLEPGAQEHPLTFEQLPFDHPLFILYSSGTSGPPKCIVHCAGGALMNSKKDCFVGFGILPTDVYFQYTTTGWMMWPFMFAGLACGARIVTYEGSPFWPDATSYLRFSNWAGVTIFGTSPRYLFELQTRNINPLSFGPHAFESLRVIVVTGSVLTAQLMEWTHSAFGGVHVGSTSGGTDVFCSFVTSVLSRPVHAGELQGPALGMAVSIFSLSGTPLPVECPSAGELVITRPHPSIPLGFLGDSDYSRFKAAYFDTFKDSPAAQSVAGIGGIWQHGDFVVRNPATGGYVFLGRSDGVLNPSGVRFGSAEIYALITPDAFPEIEDALCVGQRRPGEDDERVLLFLKMRQGPSGAKRNLDERLREKVRKTIREGLSRRHVPAGMFEVEDIPYTVNGKKIEIAVKRIVSGVDVTPSGTVSNPDSFKLYVKYRDFERVQKEGGPQKAKL